MFNCKSVVKSTQINVFSILILLCKRTSFLLQLLAVALDVFDHQVLSGQLVVVGEVVNHLFIWQAVASVHAEHVPNGLDTHPTCVYKNTCIKVIRRLNQAIRWKFQDQHTFNLQRGERNIESLIALLLHSIFDVRNLQKGMHIGATCYPFDHLTIIER